MGLAMAITMEMVMMSIAGWEVYDVLCRPLIAVALKVPKPAP